MKNKIKLTKEDLKKSKGKRMLFVILGIVYIISPIDLIPEIIPVLGFADDLLVLFALLYKVFDTGSKGASMFDSFRGEKVTNKPEGKINESEVIDGEVFDE